MGPLRQHIHPIEDRNDLTFGVAAAERNHGNDILSAWAGPFIGIARGPHLKSMALLGYYWLCFTGIPKTALAESPQDTPAEVQTVPAYIEEDDDDEIIIVSDKGVPLVGSAHVVDEEHMERMEYDDIHRVVAAVPGVYIRGEDGFGLRPNIGIRGANSDRSAKITLMEDGVLLCACPLCSTRRVLFSNDLADDGC